MLTTNIMTKIDMLFWYFLLPSPDWNYHYHNGILVTKRCHFANVFLEIGPKAGSKLNSMLQAKQPVHCTVNITSEQNFAPFSFRFLWIFGRNLHHTELAKNIFGKIRHNVKFPLCLWWTVKFFFSTAVHLNKH